MLKYVDITAFARERSGEILARSPMSAWAACASVWSRVFVLSGPGWLRHPDLFEIANRAFCLAMLRSVGVGALPSAESLLSAFEAFNIEDDGSAEWNYMIDMIEIISAPIGGKDISICLEIALHVYLAGMFNMIARVHGAATGRPISYAEAEMRLSGDLEWERAVNFVRAL